MSERAEAVHFSSLVTDIAGALAWRGLLKIFDSYKEAKHPADKAAFLIDGILFAIDKLEGEQECPHLRLTLATLQSSLRQERHAREVALLITESF